MLRHKHPTHTTMHVDRTAVVDVRSVYSHGTRFPWTEITIVSEAGDVLKLVAFAGTKQATRVTVHPDLSIGTGIPPVDPL
jgi:hypothetical protein